MNSPDLCYSQFYRISTASAFCRTSGMSTSLMTLCNDGLQDMLPQNVAPWLIDSFRVKEFEKMADAGRSLSLPLLTLLPWSMSYNSHERGILPVPEEGRHPLPEMGSLGWRNLYKQALLNEPGLPCCLFTIFYSSPNHFVLLHLLLLLFPKRDQSFLLGLLLQVFILL